ncbi:FtsX-like permease family protein, partial [Bacillus cereus]|nr:FtsX-like permease family protein [Bacillus cereus]MEB8662950.1 FtsX-like permease family protein [Bacillus cereus]MEB9386442.1 FtsX-like permease family protein [Bacillus cereus]MEB9424571.1 FtsX-like permease family protein [Bacillus cereus]MEB9461488.1 FtsX-like permease family protein [Bacillus cereus]
MKMFSVAWKNIKKSKRRSLFTCLAVILGISTLISMTVLYQKLEQSVKEEIKEQYGSAEIRVGYRESKLLNKKQVIDIKDTAKPVNSSRILINPHKFNKSYDGQWNGIYYIASDNNILAKELYRYQKDVNNNEVIISEKLADRLKVKEGNTVNLPFPSGKVLEVKVKEIIKNSSENAPGLAILNLTYIQEEFEINENINLLLLDVEEYVNQNYLKKELMNKYNQELDIDILEEYDSAKNNLKSLNVLGMVLGGLTILISSLFILSNFQMSIQQRQRELATLRAIGAKKKHVFMFIFTEAILLNTIGTIIGVILGVFCAMCLLNIVGELLGITRMVGNIDWLTVIGISFISWLFIMIISMIPAWKTTKCAHKG